MLQRDRAALARILDDVDPPYQSILFRDPDGRVGVGEIGRPPPWRQRDDVHRDAVDRIGPHVPGGVALARVITWPGVVLGV